LIRIYGATHHPPSTTTHSHTHYFALRPTLVKMLCWLQHWTFVVNAAIVADAFRCSALSTWLISRPIWLLPTGGNGKNNAHFVGNHKSV